MKQVIQSRKTGKLALKDVPAPKVRAGHLLVKTRASLISAGTERMVVDFAKKSLARKAQARPDLVKKVVEKAKREGLLNTWKAVMARLDEPLPLGYSAAGEIVAVGAGLEGEFRVGGRVAMAGAGIANHAELNVVPRNLVASIPDGVTDAEACYGTVGAIALHAVRNMNCGLGDVAAVIGCGLVGQMAARFLALGGARVVAIDMAKDRLELATRLGAELVLSPSDDVAAHIRALNGGRGADAVLNAAASSSSEPLHLAAEIARDRAQVVMVGLTGTEFPYQTFMQKELNLTVSRSYGPGRYDPDYEGRGVKYPEGWVRWTETENLSETLRLMIPGDHARLDVGALTSHTFPLENAEAAYSLVTSGSERHLGVVLNYSGDVETTPAPAVISRPAAKPGACVLGLVGAGNFARAVLIPAIKATTDTRLKTIVTQRGATATHGGETMGFETVSIDAEDVFSDAEITTVVIATRHDSHAAMTAKALRAGKSVFVEKPLALDLEQLNDVTEALNQSSGVLQVGFNRRFAPLVRDMRAHFKEASGPMVLTLRVNGGAIEGDHWTQSSDEGGGRILGEACHFVDLARHMVGAPIESVIAEAATAPGGHGDDVACSLRFADGSLASIVYTAQGDTALAKERVEWFQAGKAAVLDDFRTLSLAAGGRMSEKSATQDKGHRRQMTAFLNAVKNGGPSPIAPEELIEVSAATIAIVESLRSGERVYL